MFGGLFGLGLFYMWRLGNVFFDGVSGILSLNLLPLYLMVMSGKIMLYFPFYKMTRRNNSRLYST